MHVDFWVKKKTKVGMDTPGGQSSIIEGQGYESQEDHGAMRNPVLEGHRAHGEGHGGTGKARLVFTLTRKSRPTGSPHLVQWFA